MSIRAVAAWGESGRGFATDDADGSMAKVEELGGN